MGLFSDCGGSKGNTSVQYIEPGQYFMRVEKCHIVTTRTKNTLAAVDLTIMKVIQGETRSQKVGNEVNWGIQSNSDYFDSEMKSFIVAVAGFDGSMLEEAEANKQGMDLLDQIFSDDNPLGGIVIEMSAVHIPSKVKKDGTDSNPWTKRKFVRSLSSAEALEELSPEVVARFFPNDQLQKLAVEEAKITQKTS